MVFFFGDKEVTTHDTAKTLGIADGGVIVWRVSSPRIRVTCHMT